MTDKKPLKTSLYLSKSNQKKLEEIELYFQKNNMRVPNRTSLFVFTMNMFYSLFVSGDNKKIPYARRKTHVIKAVNDPDYIKLRTQDQSFYKNMRMMNKKVDYNFYLLSELMNHINPKFSESGLHFGLTSEKGTKNQKNWKYLQEVVDHEIELNSKRKNN